jgi:hypothetical protein
MIGTFVCQTVICVLKTTPDASANRKPVIVIGTMSGRRPATIKAKLITIAISKIIRTRRLAFGRAITSTVPTIPPETLILATTPKTPGVVIVKTSGK